MDKPNVLKGERRARAKSVLLTMSHLLHRFIQVLRVPSSIEPTSVVNVIEKQYEELFGSENVVAEYNFIEGEDGYTMFALLDSAIASYRLAFNDKFIANNIRQKLESMTDSKTPSEIFISHPYIKLFAQSPKGRKGFSVSLKGPTIGIRRFLNNLNMNVRVVKEISPYNLVIVKTTNPEVVSAITLLIQKGYHASEGEIKVSRLAYIKPLTDAEKSYFKLPYVKYVKPTREDFEDAEKEVAWHEEEKQEERGDDDADEGASWQEEEEQEEIEEEEDEAIEEDSESHSVENKFCETILVEATPIQSDEKKTTLLSDTKQQTRLALDVSNCSIPFSSGIKDWFPEKTFSDNGSDVSTSSGFPTDLKQEEISRRVVVERPQVTMNDTDEMVLNLLLPKLEKCPCHRWHELRQGTTSSSAESTQLILDAIMLKLNTCPCDLWYKLRKH